VSLSRGWTHSNDSFFDTQEKLIYQAVSHDFRDSDGENSAADFVARVYYGFNNFRLTPFFKKVNTLSVYYEGFENLTIH
jgi:hypothetical protein